MIDLRRILTKYRIPWIDHGPNCSRGAVNIQCPLCRGQDPSFHARIFEEGTGFYCLRNTRHSGSGYYLFKLLNIPTDDLPEYNADHPTTKQPFQAKNVDYAPFDRFLPASESEEMLSYLRSRNFLFPKEVVERFKLKFTPSGRWAGRIIIPLTVGWTGRAVRAHIQPRYLAETNEAGFFMHGKGLSAMLVEGAIDAMKLASVNSSMVFLAMTGGHLSPSLIYTLREQKIQRLYNSPDETVEVSQRIGLLQTLRGHCAGIQVVDTHLPPGIGKKDAGALTETEAREWLYTLPT